ncbi:MAG: hypothetical protein GKS07_05975 [Nitrosopumilus sp.]|nr:MAG: hypothetical protein GKS07_05975 [Nitrosopumilus sp.]
MNNDDITKLEKPPTSWSGKLSWLMQTGWVLIVIALQSIFTTFPEVNNEQFGILIGGGVAMISMSMVFAHFSFKVDKETYLKEKEMNQNYDLKKLEMKHKFRLEEDRIDADLERERNNRLRPPTRDVLKEK